MLLQLRSGADFAFLTFPASTWWAAYREFFCTTLLRAYLLTSENGFACPTPPFNQPSRYAALTGDILPFSAVIDIDPSPSLPSDRPVFVSYHAACTRSPENTTSFRFRQALVDAWGTLAQDMRLACSHTHRLPHREVEREYRQSVFCPLLPGDSAATWRLPEVMMAGCIPVFLFPPLHAVPLPLDVNWPAVAIFINITQQSSSWYSEER